MHRTAFRRLFTYFTKLIRSVKSSYHCKVLSYPDRDRIYKNTIRAPGKGIWKYFSEFCPLCFLPSVHGDRGSTVVKVLCYKSEGHWFDPWPNADWESIWRNLQVAPVSGLDKATWYKVIHDIFPMNVRLHRIKMSPTDTFKDCGSKDSIGHHLTECGEGLTTWGWAKSIIARTLRTTAANIRPQISLWPPQRHRAVLWVLARYVSFRMNHPCNLTRQDLMDFKRRSKWKLYQLSSRPKKVSNFLTVIDMPN